VKADTPSRNLAEDGTGADVHPVHHRRHHDAGASAAVVEVRNTHNQTVYLQSLTLARHAARGQRSAHAHSG